ncbi:MAG: amidohydrolase [Bacteroidales bacterium]|nr:amidohydrolase [Bacteroidales bacterium]
MQHLNITYFQTTIVWENRKRNRELFEKKLNQISEKNDLVLFPEMFDTGFSMNPENIQEKSHEKTLSWMQKMAARHNTAIGGSVAAFENSQFYNRFYFADPANNVLWYDKKHLFRMGQEPKHYSAGKQKILIEYKGWKILPLICYDLRFPAWSANQLTDNGPAYDLIIYVANWPASRHQVWQNLLKARAIENQSYCIGVNRVGKDGNKLLYKGDSAVYNARGEIMERSAPYLDDFVSVEISKEELKSFRKKFPVYKDWDKFDFS